MVAALATAVVAAIAAAVVDKQAPAIILFFVKSFQFSLKAG